MNDHDWMRDLACLQAFAEKYENWFAEFVEEYKESLELAEADRSNDWDKCDDAS